MSSNYVCTTLFTYNSTEYFKFLQKVYNSNFSKTIFSYQTFHTDGKQHHVMFWRNEQFLIIMHKLIIFLVFFMSYLIDDSVK